MDESILTEFLESASAEGANDSHGAFTIDAAEALRKIADYQLPYAGAWAIKILQSMVVGNSSGEIRVYLKANEIRFTCHKADCTIDEVEAAFYNPAPSPNRSL